MVVKSLGTNDGIICENPEERERIKDLLFKEIGWPRKELYVDYSSIIFYPYEKTWNFISEKDRTRYKHYSSKLFGKTNIHELW